MKKNLNEMNYQTNGMVSTAPYEIKIEKNDEDTIYKEKPVLSHTSKFTSDAIKSLNCRNARTKGNETLVGSILGNKRLKSGARSEAYNPMLETKLIKQSENFLKINFFSPALSVFNKSIDKNWDDRKNDFADYLSADFSEGKHFEALKSIGSGSYPVQIDEYDMKRTDSLDRLSNNSNGSIEAMKNERSYLNDHQDLDMLIPNLTIESKATSAFEDH